MKKIAAPIAEKPKTTSVALRVSNTHLAELAKLERRLGVQRSALIQMAIAEYIERRSK
jgi:predicted transcriptional regulator